MITTNNATIISFVPVDPKHYELCRKGHYGIPVVGFAIVMGDDGATSIQPVALVKGSLIVRGEDKKLHAWGPYELEPYRGDPWA